MRISDWSSDVCSSDLSSCNGIVDGDPAGLVHLARVDLDPDRKVAAHRRAHSANDLGHQPCAVLKRAAIIVRTPVRLGREKRRDAITMLAMQFPAVQPRSKPGIASCREGVCRTV